MQVLVIYDISNDAKRTKVADVCLDYGLDRIQYSAFWGQLTPSQRKELYAKLKRTVGSSPANVRVIPICETDYQMTLLIENKGD
jgi:CRISPR-associated protein Cas2